MGIQGGDGPDMHGEQARAWVVRLASGAMSDADLQSLDRWTAADPRNRAAFLQERRTWQDLAVLESAFADARADVPAKTYRWSYRLLPAAAAAALAWFIAPTAWIWARADARSAAGEIREIALADGSRAVLDSDSAIAIDYASDRRSIRLLKGRAWFAVRHGDQRPFRVVAAKGVVRDLATAFEVDDTGSRTLVGVTEGAVELETGGHFVLHQGERAAFGPKGTARPLGSLALDRIGSWRRGELLLRDVPLEAAIRAVARYRTAPVITLGNLSAEKPISGSFRTDRPDEALDTLAAMRGLEQAVLPGGIVLLRPGKR